MKRTTSIEQRVRTERLIALTTLCALFVLLMPERAEAIPAFARKYGFNCTMCHSSVPRLNDLGSRFRDNGYQLPGRENDEKTVLESAPPLAVRTSAGFDYVAVSHDSGATPRSGVELSGLDILAAGLLAPDLGFVLVYTPPLPADVRGVAEQEAGLEMANVVFSNLLASGVAVRVGRFEPAYVAFSVKRHLSFSPYEAYGTTFVGGSPADETQEGIEATAAIGALRMAAGLVNGSATNRRNDVPADGYLRLATVLGAGEGQLGGQRLGVMAHYGLARPDQTLGGGERRGFVRLGADASVNVSHWNLALQVIWSRDDASLWAASAAVATLAGFAEVTYAPRSDLVALARYDLVRMDGAAGLDVARGTLGGRYYVIDNLALHVEYSHRQQNGHWLVGRGGQREDAATARLDLIF